MAVTADHSAVGDTISKLKAVQAEFDAAVKQISDSLLPLFKDFISENPKVEAIGWTQYTPYFNDGEPCVFSVGETNFRLAGVPVEDAEETEERYTHYENWEWEYKPWVGMYSSSYRPSAAADTWERVQESDYHWETDFLTKEEFTALWEFAMLLQSDVMEAVLLKAFDDHVTVKVTMDEIVVDEYNHD